jgi:MFS transporter, SHS family, lactate transporter
MGERFMSAAAANTIPIPWWKEPTKDQWLAWVAAWLGWTLDSFDFTIFLLLMVPIAKDFGVPLTEVAIVFTLTLWMRLVGATASGWLADRIGRKKPLMISIAWFSVCNLFAGLAPSTTLAEIFTGLCRAEPFAAVRTARRPRASDVSDDKTTHGG